MCEAYSESLTELLLRDSVQLMMNKSLYRALAFTIAFIIKAESCDGKMKLVHDTGICV